MPSRFLPIQVGTDPSQQLAIINKNFAELDAEGTKKLFYDSTGTPSVFIGIDGTGQSVVKVSKPGIDVTTAIGNDLAFNSSQDVLKVVKTGTATVSSPAIVDAGAGVWQGGAIQTTVAHNLGFVPVIISYMQFGGSIYQPLPYQTLSVPSSGSYVQSTYTVSVDATNLYLSGTVAALHVAQPAASYTVKYYLLQETAA